MLPGRLALYPRPEVPCQLSHKCRLRCSLRFYFIWVHVSYWRNHNKCVQYMLRIIIVKSQQVDIIVRFIWIFINKHSAHLKRNKYNDNCSYSEAIFRFKITSKELKWLLIIVISKNSIVKFKSTKLRIVKNEEKS